MPSDLAFYQPSLARTTPVSKLIFMVPMVFEPLKFDCSYCFSWGYSGSAIVLSKLPVPWRPAKLDYSRARASLCTCNRCGWGCLGHVFSHLSFLFFLPLSVRRPNID